MSQDISASEERVRVPIMQRVLDNPFLLLFIHLVETAAGSRRGHLDRASRWSGP
jgi:hypothetical protein